MEVRSAKTIDVRALLALAFALVALAPLAGCGDKRVPLASLKGRVTFQGQPVTGGVRIVFINKEAGTYNFANLKDDGSYVMDVGEGIGLYPGEYKVAIRLNQPPMSGIPGDKNPPPPTRPDVPVRYHSAKLSGLTLKLDAAGAVYNVDMKP